MEKITLDQIIAESGIEPTTEQAEAMKRIASESMPVLVRNLKMGELSGLAKELLS